MKEIFLYFCTHCGEVRVLTVQLNKGQSRIPNYCDTCKTGRQFAPLAYSQAQHKFITVEEK